MFEPRDLVHNGLGPIRPWPLDVFGAENTCFRSTAGPPVFCSLEGTSKDDRMQEGSPGGALEADEHDGLLPRNVSDRGRTSADGGLCGTFSHGGVPICGRVAGRVGFVS